MTKFLEYLLTSVNAAKKNEIDDYNSRNNNKKRIKIIKILIK